MSGLSACLSADLSLSATGMGDNVFQPLRVGAPGFSSFYHYSCIEYLVPGRVRIYQVYNTLPVVLILPLCPNM